MNIHYVTNPCVLAEVEPSADAIVVDFSVIRDSRTKRYAKE